VDGSDSTHKEHKQCCRKVVEGVVASGMGRVVWFVVSDRIWVE
jgi:hypothetical protein